MSYDLRILFLFVFSNTASTTFFFYHNQISKGHFRYWLSFPLLLKMYLPRTPSLILLTCKLPFFNFPIAVFWSTRPVSIFQFRTGICLSEGDFVHLSIPELPLPLSLAALSTQLSTPEWALELALVHWWCVSTYIYLFKFIAFSFS